ncbi:hypothetical protein E2C01_042459 [Portunus trituberculatus]|uniref:Uncharacterized protein n=1 Tax=Portunus trituberculatus TaxID=210409 RepID=A0A5B7FUV3_PORTR|nr:hypothetical protein [Portunus trituberculatus]
MLRALRETVLTRLKTLQSPNQYHRHHSRHHPFILAATATTFPSPSPPPSSHRTFRSGKAIPRYLHLTGRPRSHPFLLLPALYRLWSTCRCG